MQPDNTIDVDALADRLARGDLAEDDREGLWRQLLFAVVLPRAQRLEQELGCERLVNEALETLPRRLGSYRREKGRFSAWLETTLRNLARDEMRARRRYRHYSRMSDLPERPREEEAEGRTPREERRDRLDRALERLGRTPRSSRQKTDFHAVLLTSLRLAVVSRLKRSRKALAVWGETRTGRAAEQQPWSEVDAGRVVQAGWPKLATIWATLAAGLEASGKNPTDERVVALLVGLRGIVGLNAEAWRQWRKRAVAWGVRLLGLDAWQADVEPWLETRAPRRLLV